MNHYECLFNKLGFKNKQIRDSILGKFNKEIENFKKKNKLNSNDLVEIYRQYVSTTKKQININNFIFIDDTEIILSNSKIKDFFLPFFLIKSVLIIDENKQEFNEWIFSVKYLHYLLDNIYHFNHPKFAHSIDSMESDNRVLSINDENIYEFIDHDWNVIYESSKSIDFEKIKKFKYIPHFDNNKKSDKYFYSLAGLTDKEIADDHSSCFPSLSIFREKLDENSFKNKIAIFHNEDKYFGLKFLKLLDNLYHLNNKGKNFGYLYINFKLLKNISSRQERLEYFAYSLLSLFPYNYQYFEEFFEDNIKNLLSEKENCLVSIIKEILKYFKNEFVNKETSQRKLYPSNKVNDKVLYIVFHNILDSEYNSIIESIILSSNNNFGFKFIAIYPLINVFTFEKFVDYLSERIYITEFSLYFINQKNNTSLIQQQGNGNNQKIKIFNENINDEQKIYDLIRIYHFKEIFVTSINYKSNLESINFLTNYYYNLNIQFDNKERKIIDIDFKNKTIKNKFDEKYKDALNYIKAKTNQNIFKDILGQRDGFDLEKIIISTVLNTIKNFKTLEVQSIFSLRDLKKEKNMNYEFSSFYLKQRSLGGEIFDFGIKIKTSSNKQFLKLGQETFEKTEDELKKISKEKMKIYCSYIQKEFKEKELGDLDGISFFIISPERILENRKSYKLLKKFCKENGYEFILFNLSKRTFFKRNKGKNIPFDYENWNKVNTEFLLDVPKFKDIIDVKNNLQMLSPRRVKNRDEDIEDLNSQKKAKKYIKKEIKRIAKLEYNGTFSDITSLNTNYFAYLYDKNNAAYFFKNKFLDFNINNEDSNNRKINIILYSFEEEKINYIDSSPENEIKKKIVSQKNKKSLKNKQILTSEDKKKENIPIKKNYKIENFIKKKEKMNVKVEKANISTKLGKKEKINIILDEEDEKKIKTEIINNNKKPKINPFVEKITKEKANFMRKRKREIYYSKNE